MHAGWALWRTCGAWTRTWMVAWAAGGSGFAVLLICITCIVNAAEGGAVVAVTDQRGIIRRCLLEYKGCAAGAVDHVNFQNLACRAAARQEESSDSPPGSVTLQQRGQPNRTPPTPDVRLYHRAVVVAQVQPSLPARKLALR